MEYNVYIAIPEDNFKKDDVLCNYMDMVYASTDEKIAMRCLDSTKDVIHVIEASIPANKIGYMPLRNHEYDPDVDVYVDDVRQPKVFLINHRNITLKNRKIIKCSGSDTCCSSDT